MKILVIPHAYSTNLVIREIELARCWADRHEVYVVRPPVLNGARSIRDKIAFHVSALRVSEELGADGLHWVTVPAAYRLPVLQEHLNRWAMRTIMARWGFDVVVNASYFGNAAAPGAIGAEIPRGRYRYIYDFVDDHVGGYRLYGREHEAQLADRVIRQETSKADHVVSITQYLRNVCRAQYGCDSHVVSNGFHPANVTGDQEQALRQRIGLHDGPVLGYIGSLDGWVNLEFAIEVFTTLQLRRPELQLLIVGGGARQQLLQDRHGTTQGLHLTGWIPREEVAPYFRLIDVGLVPFEENALTHAALPIKAIEYGGHGRPVVASALQGLIEQHLSYVRCRPMQVDLWCNEIESSLRERPAERAFLDVARYRWETLAAQMEELF